MKIIKNKIVKNDTKKCRLWLWVFIAFFVGGAIGYTTHFLIANWNKLFVVCPNENKPEMCCPNGNKPDKHGCCDGEVYTDAGGGWMVCCPDGADNCFPPLK